MNSGILRVWLAGIVLSGMAQHALAQSLRPEPGLWYNPDRSGHGVDFQFSGNTLVGIWYTYDSLGQPTWYIASGPYTGTSWSAPLLGARWNGSSATLTQVGAMSLKLHEDDRADFSWNVDGNTGSEPFERLRFGANVPAANLTGIYHHAAQTGWGLSFEVQGSTTAAVLYFYDAAGLPRWALGTGTLDAAGAPKAAANSIAMSAFFSFGSNAPYSGAPTLQPAGSLSLVDGRLVIDVLMPDGLGLWQRDVPASLLTDPDPSYLFAHIQGPSFIPAGASVPYSARFDTDLRALDALEFDWTVVYGDRVVQSTASTVDVQPMGVEGLVTLQLVVVHPPSGRSAFATLTTSAQVADLFDVTIVPGRSGVLVGRDNRFDAVVIGGRAPFAYRWEGDFLVSPDTPSTFLNPPCTATGTADLRVYVEDADHRVADSRIEVIYASGQCSLTLEGPDCLDSGVPNGFRARLGGKEYRDDGRYLWTVPSALALTSCNSSYCALTGTPGAPDQFFAIRVEHPVYGSAERRIARVCPDGLRLAIRATPASLRPTESLVDFVFTASGGTPPYRMSLSCIGGDTDVEPTGGDAIQNGRCEFFPAAVRNQVARIMLRDARYRGYLREVFIPVVDPDALAATLSSPRAPFTCVPHALAVAISNGSPPFAVTLDFGDGSAPHSSQSSSRNLEIEHVYAPASAGVPRILRLRVADAAGTAVDVERSFEPVNAVVDVTVQLRNAGFDNIHIYDTATSASTWFDASTRVSPGAQREAQVSIPLNACETQATWGAGRQGTPLANPVTCSYRKSQPIAGVTYSESSGATLGCD
ncbi:MAG: hypothetical protein IT479_01305 [Xanthomonadales bacterium]|nr:hypothetical protein [Xanthomonadales bacterium]